MSRPAEDRRRVDDRELWLAATMMELAEALDAEDAEAEYARCLTSRLADLLAPAETGLLIADDVGCLIAAAASTERVLDLISHEARSGEGPSASCYLARTSMLNQSVLVAGGPWPPFAVAARTAGFATVSVLPMQRRDQAIGVVTVLGPAGHRLTRVEARLAQVLAQAAAIALSQQRERRDAERTARQLQRALDSRVVIEQAKGAVAARLGITPDAAFELLRGYARQASRPLVDVAAETVRGELPAHRLVASPQVGRNRSAARR